MHARFAAITMIACCWLAPCTGRGAEPIVAPVVYDEAYLVARVDFEKVELGTWYAMLDESPGIWGLPSLQSARRFLGAFRRAGGRDLYLVGSGSTEVFFAPVAQGADAAAIEKSLAESPLGAYVDAEATAVLAGGVVAGRRSMVEFLGGRKAAPRANLKRALEATAGFSVQVVLVPPDDNRRMTSEINASLLGEDAAAKALAQIALPAATAVTKRIAWASIGIDGPPEPRLKMVFAAAEPAEVDQLEAALSVALDPLLAHPGVRRNVALVENLRRVFQWKRAADTLTLAVDDRSGELTMVARGMIRPIIEETLLAAARKRTSQQLRTIAIGLHNYHDANRRFPPPAVLDGEGKPLLSWRVLILPFLEENELYQQFHLDEPWDSPHNIKLLSRMPEVFRCAAAKVSDDHTVFLVPRGEGTVFSGPEGTPIRRIIDGTSRTIAIVVADDNHGVPWTKPDDWRYDPEQPTAGLGRRFEDRLLMVLCDGSFHAVPAAIDPDTMRNLITCDDRVPVDIPH